MPTTLPHWTPRNTPTPSELAMLERMQHHRKLFFVLYRHREELFDSAFQDELCNMYRDTGEGKPPASPALLAMTLLLQAYSGVSDREAVELSVVDRRWQLVLDTTDDTEPTFSKTTLNAFRQRLCEHGLDARLLERLRGIAQRTTLFDWRKLPKSLRPLSQDEPPISQTRGTIVATVDPSVAKILRAAARALERKTNAAARQ